MDFNKVVIPLFALKHGTDDQVLHGSGFLARINGQTWLVTVAHLADYVLAPRCDWTLWPNQLFAADVEDGSSDRIEQFNLFIEGHNGKRVPRFRYQLREDRPGTIADIILLPLQPEHRAVKTYSSFNLPEDKGPHQVDEVVTLLGRRDPFPALSVTQHRATRSAGPVRFIAPEAQQGDSGGPVLSSTGFLLGMNVGSHMNLPSEAMLMSPEAIESLAESVRGSAEDWPGFQP